MGGGAWWITVHGAAKNRTQQSTRAHTQRHTIQLITRPHQNVLLMNAKCTHRHTFPKVHPQTHSPHILWSNGLRLDLRQFWGALLVKNDLPEQVLKQYNASDPLGSGFKMQIPRPLLPKLWFSGLWWAPRVCISSKHYTGNWGSLPVTFHTWESMPSSLPGQLGGHSGNLSSVQGPSLENITYSNSVVHSAGRAPAPSPFSPLLAL